MGSAETHAIASPTRRTRPVVSPRAAVGQAQTVAEKVSRPFLQGSGRLGVAYDTRTTFRRLRPRATLKHALDFRRHYSCRIPNLDRSPNAGCFRHQLLLPRPYLVLTKPLRLDIQCQRAVSVKIGWKYLDD